MEIYAWAAVVLSGVVWTKQLKDLSEKIESVENIWKFIKECPELLGYRTRLEEKLQILQKKIDLLSSHKADVDTELESSEFRCGSKRKRVVENWTRNVERKKTDVASIRRRFGEGNSWFQPRLRSSVMKSIREIEELLAQCDFSNGLLETHRNGGEALLSTTLAGQVTTNKYLESVWEFLTDDNVLSIGVHGCTGVGKTNLLTHIHNKALENKDKFDRVYFVTASQGSTSTHKLQNDIAKQVGLDLSGDDGEMKRAAKLYAVLTKTGRSVLIIDNIEKHFYLDVVGIPTSGCKLVISTQSISVCRKIGCDKTVKVEPLPKEEAENLFMQTLKSKNQLSQEVEAMAKQIIEACEGVPLGIIKLATRMRGVDDSSEWRYLLNEVNDFKKGFSDRSDMSYLWD